MAQARSKTIALPAIVDLDALDPIRDELVDAIESGPVTVSAAAIERVATNALFMLLSAAETARRNNFAFSVSAPSEAFQLAVSRLGLEAPFAAIMEG
ncbi:MAG TPA: STAS domain-containing protein [Devosia sp.]|jgi:anti-anti-sigma regulatory factor|uniref:STAS domain-containing protein n=1 Tax=Devosia sp. TaxID=1871048 RepID=UPI002DDCF22E|nr:STAS domain-containing protein [Devosia sp.]HEV2517746.1 STAS domain-containing protein [Devosia sp.]